jgi:hypothetical protein
MLENPDLTREDADVLAEDMYKLDEDQYDEKTIKLSQTKLKIDANRFEKNLLDMQVKALDPVIDPKKAEQEFLQLQETENQRKFNEEYEKRATEEIGKFKELKVKIGEKDEDVFVYQPDKSDMELISEIAKNPQKIFALWRNQDGTPNQAKMIADLASLRSAGKMNQKMIEAVKAKAIEDYIKVKKNIDFEPKGKGQATERSDNETYKQLAANHR